jgi:Pseudomonas avirulence D protein (AvrD)
MTSEAPDGFEPIERVLGPARSRYFGAGYRGVRYRVNPDPAAHRGAASAIVDYPELWSVDGSGRARSPHLSSVDAVVLPLMLVEATSTQDELEILRQLFVASIDLRAGTEPWPRLDDVPLEVTTARMGNGLRVQGRVGNIRVSIDLTLGSAPPHPSGDASVYGGLFQTTSCETSVGAMAEHGRLDSRHRVRYAVEPRYASGVEADWWPGLTMIDCLVALGQLSQALVFATAGVSRAAAGTLWMRTMRIRRTIPAFEPTDAFTSSATIARDRVLGRLAGRVHDVEVVAETSTGVSARSCVAYAEGEQ